MSVQSNNLSSSGASASEQTVEPFYVSLVVEPGHETEIICWALTTLREKFYNDAADELAARNVSGFVEATRNIGSVNEFLGEIMRQINKAHCQLSTIKEGRILADADEGDKAFWKAKEEKFADRFGWNE